ncbi:MAG: di-trans,poly-cis-decaprenylcistransferase [Candidatus Daviesbacteria bacterium]|nr:MAG: di-trans,poly-cis-decaprenylcistransferase [Candidatus Daviesbacteria bacterium]
MPESEEQLNLPKHLVLIPDGNGRWARKHNLPIEAGHFQGAQAIREILYELQDMNVEVVTVWGFSTENWSRSPEESANIMGVMRNLIQIEGERLAEKGIKFRYIGRRDRVPQDLLLEIINLEEKTVTNQGKTFVLALDYGGRDEIIRAVNKVGGQPVDENSFKEFLDTAGLPDPDLIIRTSGEMRTSGILPYQSVYAEFVSSPALLPDFNKNELLKCLNEYSRRQRRFGHRPDSTIRATFSWLNLPENSLDGFMGALLPVLDQTANKFVEQWRQGRFYKNSPAQEDIDIFQKLLSGGKKLRPALVALGYENFRGEEEFLEGMLTAAISYEIIHNSFLIHDDIMDNSLIRRGQPSVHDQYRALHENQGGVLDSTQYGIAAAINAGDLGPFRALKAVCEIENKPDRIVKAEQWLRYVIETTLQGQRRDLTEIPLDQLTEKYVYQIHHQKTAVYSVVGPLTLGAILAGASEKELAYLNTFGVSLGIAFQIIDDHLGLYGDERVLGKSVVSDTKEAKKTLQFTQAYRLATSQQRQFLKEVWGKQDITIDELAQVRQLIEELGVKEVVLQRADLLAQRAKNVIPQITSDQTMSDILEELTTFVVKRDF